MAKRTPEQRAEIRARRKQQTINAAHFLNKLAEQRADRRRQSQERLAEIERLKRIHGSEPLGLPMNAKRWDMFIEVAKEIERKKQDRKVEQWKAAQPSPYSPRDLRMLAHLMNKAIEAPELAEYALGAAAKAFSALATPQSF